MSDFADGLVLGMMFVDNADAFIRAAIDDDSGNLKIIFGDGAEKESHSVFYYTYETQEISETVTTVTTVGEVSTTHSETFTAQIITALYDISAALVLSAKCGADGKISAYFDKNKRKVYTADFPKNIADSILISGADAPAIAYVIAKNSEQLDSLDKQKRAYKRGIKEGQENGGEPVKEPIDKEITDDKLDYPVDLDTSIDFNEGEDGIYLTFANEETGETTYMHFYNNGKKVYHYGYLYGYGELWCDITGNGITGFTGGNCIFESSSYVHGYFRPAQSSSTGDLITGDLINGLVFHRNRIDASLVYYGWNQAAGGGGWTHTPRWTVKEGYKCVRVSNSDPRI